MTNVVRLHKSCCISCPRKFQVISSRSSNILASMIYGGKFWTKKKKLKLIKVAFVLYVVNGRAQGAFQYFAFFSLYCWWSDPCSVIKSTLHWKAVKLTEGNSGSRKMSISLLFAVIDTTKPKHSAQILFIILLSIAKFNEKYSVFILFLFFCHFYFKICCCCNFTFLFYVSPSVFQLSVYDHLKRLLKRLTMLGSIWYFFHV